MKSFVPLLLFLTMFISIGMYFEAQGIEYAFYQISPTVIILPSIIIAIAFHEHKLDKALDKFIAGMADKQIISMIIIFLLAGAFTAVTKSIGGVDSVVNLLLTIIQSSFIIPGIFLISALLGTAMGTSMGVIAAVAPIAMTIAKQIGPDYQAICIATVISGAMFGDNLSLISDTTIAAVQSQSASLFKKFKLNAIFSTISAIVTILVLMLLYPVETEVTTQDFSFITIIPYAVVITLAVLQVNVFVVLLLGIIFAGIIGITSITDYHFIQYSQDIYSGFLTVHEVMLLSLFIGGLIHLVPKQAFIDMINKISISSTKKAGEFIIAIIASVSDILLANNTIAILVTGGTAKEIASKHNISPHRSAFLIDSFSCIFQGIIPHGAQIILASSLSGIGPFTISLKVFFCYIMASVILIYINFDKSNSNKNTN